MLVNDIYVWGGYTPELLKFLQWEKPIRMPKPFDDAPDKPYWLPHMEMSPEVYQKIDWQAKLDRGAENIDMLMEDGRKRAREFLEARKRVVEAGQFPSQPAQQSEILEIRQKKNWGGRVDGERGRGRPPLKT